MDADTALFIIGAWLIGGIPFGYMAGRAKGIDIREHGSGNIGATNVTRILGKKLGISCFICDAAKGFIPVFIAANLAAKVDANWPTWLPIATVFATVAGHIWTPFLRFRGGKGIATSAGALAGVAPIPIGAAFMVWLLTFSITRYVSLASIIGAVTLPIAGISLRLFAPTPQNTISIPTIILLTVIGLLAIIRHRSNVTRLLNGTENKFERKAKQKSDT